MTIYDERRQLRSKTLGDCNSRNRLPVDERHREQKLTGFTGLINRDELCRIEVCQPNLNLSNPKMGLADMMIDLPVLAGQRRAR